MLEFIQDQKPIVLKGVLPPPRRVNLHSLTALLPSQEVTECYEILLLKPEDQAVVQEGTEAFPPTVPPSIVVVLEKFRSVFALLVGMPPQRPYDHRVHLLIETRPINVRTYRYPYFQKIEIEKQVRDMLEQGIIQRSNNLFSSPVLLIHKKDGTFHYRALNNATVLHHFSIPTADELFDELGKVGVFTKLDLRSGYHQIRMHEEDVCIQNS